MSTTTRLTFAEYEKLPEKEGVRYELDEGTLLMEPSPALNHNLIRQRIASHLTQFVRSHNLGIVVEQMDFRLDTDTVRNPDVAFIVSDDLRDIDPDHSPVEGAPALAIEVISPTNLAQDTAKKVRQYLEAGSQAVWLVYPTLRLIEIHDAAGAHRITEPESLQESKIFSGFRFSLSLNALFDDILSSKTLEDQQDFTVNQIPKRKPKLRSQQEIRAWLDSLAQFSDKVPPLPEKITREWIYQDHD